MKPPLSRSRLVGRLRERLERAGHPRLQMALIVLVTGGAGFLASALLLRAGLDSLWLRYLCAFAVAYPVFLALLWLWLRTRPGDYADFPDLSGFTSSSSGPAPGPGLPRLPELAEGGGQFGGGGASGQFEVAEAGLMPDSAGDLGDAAGDALGSVGDADELAVVLLVLALLLALLITSAWLVYMAPGLFAELTVDGALSAGLYRRLRKADTQSWLETALRRTWPPFALSALAAAACGWWLQDLVPGANSIAAVLAGL